jgi:hypothetical protein
MAAGSLAERLPGVFVQYLPDGQRAKIFVNPVIYALAGSPEQIMIVVDHSRESAYLLRPEKDWLEGAGRQIFDVEQGAKGVIVVSISRSELERMGIVEGHHVAWGDDREGYIAFPLSIIDMAETEARG